MEKAVVSAEAVRQVLRDYVDQYKKHPLRSAVALLLPGMGSILVVFVPPLIFASIINTFIAEKAISLTPVWGHIVLLGVLWMLGEVFWRIGVHHLISLEAMSMNALNRSAFVTLIDREYEFYTNQFVGSLTKKVVAYARSFEMFSDTLSMNIGTNVIPMLFVIAVTWTYSPWIPAVLVGWLALAVVVSMPIIRKRSILVILRHEAGSKLSGRLSDVLTNMLAVKSFAKEKKEMQRYGAFVDGLSNSFKKAADYHNLKLDLVMSPVYVLANVTGLAVAILLADRLSLPAGTVVVIFAYYKSVTGAFWDINRIYRGVESSLGEAAEFTQLVLEAPKVEDAPDAKKLKVSDANVHFDNVSFHYGERLASKKSFLHKFNLDVKAKQRVGLIGPSGSGKTTITKLLLRFIDLESGSINIDGQAISDITQESLRNAIAYVPQETMLFHRSLYENIAYGNEKASRAQVIKAAKIAHAHDFISSLPKGYDTMVGERGIKLSGGQRQRVAIARAILKNAPILVLDEATSSLDSESEKYIQDGLRVLMKGKTVIVIAHRLSTIRHLDRIVVLDKGKISQDGTHEQLMKKKGLYSKLWKHQSGGFIGEEA